MTEDRILRQLAAELSKPDLAFAPASIRKGVVVSVAWGNPPTATVNIGGKDVAGLRFDRSYTPLVDDVVWLVKDGSSYAVGGALATESWKPVVYQNGWTDWGGGYQTVGYKLDAMGFVNFMGVARPGTETNGTVVFNLPVKYRPGLAHQFHPYGSLSFILEVQTDGDVVITNHPGGGAPLAITGFRYPIV